MERIILVCLHTMWGIARSLTEYKQQVQIPNIQNIGGAGVAMASKLLDTGISRKCLSLERIT